MIRNLIPSAVLSDILRYTMGGITYYFAYPEADQNRGICYCTEEVHSSDADSGETGCNCYYLQTHPGTPLQFAALGGSEAIVRLLLKAGADIDEGGGIVYVGKNDEILCTDGTALELAKRQGHVGVVNILLEAVEKLRLQKIGEGFSEEEGTLNLKRKRVRVR